LQEGKHPNLHVLTETKVERVIFDEHKRAIGLVVLPNKDRQPTTSLSEQPRTSITAKKFVVVAAGALGTPQILEKSGIGQREHLTRLQIPVVANVPGVGENYQDHHLCILPYKTSLAPEETNDALLSGRIDFMKAVEEKNSILGWNSIDLGAKLRPSDAEVESLGPEFQTAWEKDFKDKPSRPLMLMAVCSSFLGDPSLIPAGQYCTIGCYTAYPYSRGSIHITGRFVDDAPDFDTGILNDKDDLDLEAHVWAYKRQREIFRRLSTYRSELELGHPKFAVDSPAALASFEADSKPEPSSTEDRIKLPNIEYSAEDDKVIEQFIRENVNTTWHSLGTCAMRPFQDGGVVDKDLNVYGVQGLKLCDLSVIPENVGANTNNTALMVGEKAAEIMVKELMSNV
jgi:alcohol oxidase